MLPIKTLLCHDMGFDYEAGVTADIVKLALTHIAAPDHEVRVMAVTPEIAAKIETKIEG